MRPGWRGWWRRLGLAAGALDTGWVWGLEVGPEAARKAEVAGRCSAATRARRLLLSKWGFAQMNGRGCGGNTWHAVGGERPLRGLQGRVPHAGPEREARIPGPPEDRVDAPPLPRPQEPGVGRLGDTCSVGVHISGRGGVRGRGTPG